MDIRVSAVFPSSRQRAAFFVLSNLASKASPSWRCSAAPAARFVSFRDVMTYQPPKNGMFSDTLFLSVGDKYIDPGLRDRSAFPSAKRRRFALATCTARRSGAALPLERLGGSARRSVCSAVCLGPRPQSCVPARCPGSPSLPIGALRCWETDRGAPPAVGAGTLGRERARPLSARPSARAHAPALLFPPAALPHPVNQQRPRTRRARN